jgi:hypothetical protein
VLGLVVLTGTVRGAPAPITKADCVKAMFPERIKGDPLPSGEIITKVEVLSLSPDLAVCRVERSLERHERSDDGGVSTWADTTIELAPVTRRPRLSAGEHIDVATKTQLVDIHFGYVAVPSGGTEVALSPVPLTTRESAVLVEVTTSFADPGIRSHKTVSTLYRVARSRLTDVVSFESSYERNNEERTETSSECRVVAVKLQSAMPKTIAVACERTETQPGSKPSTMKGIDRYRWDGTRYERHD